MAPCHRRQRTSSRPGVSRATAPRSMIHAPIYFLWPNPGASWSCAICDLKNSAALRGSRRRQQCLRVHRSSLADPDQDSRADAQCDVGKGKAPPARRSNPSDAARASASGPRQAARLWLARNDRCGQSAEESGIQIPINARAAYWVSLSKVRVIAGGLHRRMSDRSSTFGSMVPE